MPSPKLAVRTVVRVSQDAFLSMCFSAAEAGLVAPDFNRQSYKLLAAWEKARGNLPIRQAPMPPSLVFSKTGREVGGVLFGDVKRSKNQTVISLEWAMTTTAISSDDEVAQSGASALLLADLAEAAGKPFGSVVACWHSHVFLTVSPREVAKHELYSPSELDLEGLALPNSAVSLIVTVAWPDKAKPRPINQPNLVCRKVGDFDFFLTAHRHGAMWLAADPTLEIVLAA